MKRTLFNSGWSFALKKIGEKPNCCDFKEVDLPHDWLISDTRRLYADGDGYYKKSFTLHDVDKSVYIIRFEGVYMDCEIFLNGKKIFEWKYGYTTFDVELTDCREGENEILVTVHYKSPNSRWYSGAGIYRNVYLTQSGKNRILPDGIYFYPRMTGGRWKVSVDTEVVGDGEAAVKNTLFDRRGNEVVSLQKSCLLCSDMTRVHQEFTLDNAELWDIENPRLYLLKTELVVNGETVYEVLQKVGFKTAEFTPDNGFFLNGKYLKIRGACMHHDMGALGSAVNKNAVRRQLEKMKEMGVNAIRTSHNPPSVELMDLADEMGIMIMSEAFDMWELKKTEFDYARFFPEWHERDVRSWIRRDRNRASVIIWSIGNEIYDTHASERGAEITEELKRCVRIDDYYCLHPITIGSNYMQWEGAQRCADLVDLQGYNYSERLYDEHKQKHPHWIIYGSETGSTIQSRGIYHFPASLLTTTHDDNQCSSLLNCATGWGSPCVEYNIIQDRNRKYCLGQFIWTAWDYIGEPTPYWTKNSYFGHIDTAGFEKDSFYAYKSEWVGSSAEPFVHIFPYWDFNPGQMIDVFIFSNCASTELFVNGHSQGTYHCGDPDTLSGRWRIPYEYGEITAVGYDEDGNELCKKTRRSFGDPVKIILTPSKCELYADGEDMIFVEMSTVDKDGYPVENGRSRVSVSVSGAGRLVGLDNGDSSDYDQYKGSSRRLFSGKLLAMIAAKDVPGDISVTVTSPWLEGASLSLKALPSQKTEGVCCSYECPKSDENCEIPIRKIELRTSSVHLTPESCECEACVKIYPENATYTADDIEFKAVTDAGVITNLARIEKKDGRVKVIPCGDGEYRLRAFCKNGTRFDQIISELEMKNTGFGTASFDPYGSFVPASLYSAATTSLQNVFEGGVQTLSGDTFIEFKNIEFGNHGSDELEVGIYLNAYERIPFEITDEKGELLGSFVYYKPQIWNHYQYETCKLNRKLTGSRSIRFVFHREVRFKGFRFKRPDRVGKIISAVDNDGIYGDSFEIRSDCIAGIGNNVTIEFGGFDFGDEGVTAVEITGRTHNKNDTLHMQFCGEYGKDNQIAEFSGTDRPVTRRFELKKVTGKTDLKLIFLPGSSFDLYSIRFLR